MFFARLVFLFTCLALHVSLLSAESYRCELREYGYSAAFNSLDPALSRSEKREFLESLLPKVFKVNSRYVTVDNSRYEVSGGDREKSFQVRVNTNLYNLTYYIKVNPFTGTGTIYVRPGSNYVNVGPIRYLCNSTGGPSYKRSSFSSPFRQEFGKLTSCNRKYVQQFLRGQNLYNGAIDGLWGARTAEGLKKAKKLSAFKNLTTVQMFEKLKLNPICD